MRLVAVMCILGCSSLRDQDELTDVIDQSRKMSGPAWKYRLQGCGVCEANMLLYLMNIDYASFSQKLKPEDGNPDVTQRWKLEIVWFQGRAGKQQNAGASSKSQLMCCDTNLWMKTDDSKCEVVCDSPCETR